MHIRVRGEQVLCCVTPRPWRCGRFGEGHEPAIQCSAPPPSPPQTPEFRFQFQPHSRHSLGALFWCWWCGCGVGCVIVLLPVPFSCRLRCFAGGRVVLMLVVLFWCWFVLRWCFVSAGGGGCCVVVLARPNTTPQPWSRRGTQCSRLRTGGRLDLHHRRL